MNDPRTPIHLVGWTDDDGDAHAELFTHRDQAEAWHELKLRHDPRAFLTTTTPWTATGAAMLIDEERAIL